MQYNHYKIIFKSALNYFIQKISTKKGNYVLNDYFSILILTV